MWRRQIKRGDGDFICLYLGVAKQSCWHLPLVATPTFDCSISYNLQQHERNTFALYLHHDSITSPTLVSSLLDPLGSQSLRWKTLQDTTCNIFLDSEKYFCEDDWDWIIDVVTVRIFRTISKRIFISRSKKEYRPKEFESTSLGEMEDFTMCETQRYTHSIN